MNVLSSVINGESITTSLACDDVAGADDAISGVGLQKISASVRADRNLVPSIPQIGAIKDFEPDPGT